MSNNNLYINKHCQGIAENDRGINYSVSSAKVSRIDLKQCVSYLVLMQACRHKMLHLTVHDFRNRRVYTDAIKSTCALLSSTCGISNERTYSCQDHCKGVV